MAPHDSRNIFCSSTPDTELPVVFPHHLLMLAVASTASKGSTAKTCPQESMENAKAKTISCPQNSSSLHKSSDSYSDTKIDTEEEQSEIRRIIEMSCTVIVDESSSQTKLSLLLRLEDQMNRQLNCSVSENETGVDLANELVEYGLISELDRDKVAEKIGEHLEI